MFVRNKKRENTEDILKPNEDEVINDNLDLLVKLIRVNVRLKDQIKEDFKACFLDDQDKEGIIESTVDAFDSKNLVYLMLKRHRNYVWENEKWHRKTCTAHQLSKCTETTNRLFDGQMNKPFMTVIMNVNRKDNHLVNVVADFQEKVKEEQNDSKKLLDILKKNEEKGDKQ